jgi:hypothetical protein
MPDGRLHELGKSRAAKTPDGASENDALGIEYSQDGNHTDGDSRRELGQNRFDLRVLG